LFVPFTMVEFLLFTLPIAIAYWIALFMYSSTNIDMAIGFLSVFSSLAVGVLATALMDKNRRKMSRYSARVDLLNHKLAEANEKLEKSNRAMGDFLAVCSHDLKNRLSAIGNAAEILEVYWAKLDEKKKADYLESISQEASMMGTLIRDILDLAALDQGEFSIRREPVKLGDLARSAGRTAELSGAGKGIKVDIDIEEELEPAEVDSHRIAQALDNLVANAVRHSPENGTIRLAVSGKEAGWQVIEVEDEGEGVADSDREKIFEPYVSGRSRGSVGLGLAIVKRLVELNGGKVEVDSGRAGGAVFRVLLKSHKRRHPN
ncbi:MAG: HAMP domain-containing histidine kinase, partial [Deltaproteobacteria bacterium]|nr:HAMP domain-containing histidine kinase [Deltaproteobacteria bacterium]